MPRDAGADPPARAAYTIVRGNVLALSRQATNNAAAYQMARTELDPAVDRHLTALGALVDYSRARSDQATQEIQSVVRTSQLGSSSSAGNRGAGGIGLAILITRNTANSLHVIAAGLNQGADQLWRPPDR